jgi:alpha-beta hydrolase superfamily lysophospholipase
MQFTDFLVPASAGVAIVALFTVGFACVFTRQWGKPRRVATGKTPADYGLPFEPVSFTSHGVQLQGWFIPSHMPTARGTIIVAHGWSHSAVKLLSIALRLREAGFAVFLYDTRGHGASGDDGFISIAKFAEDLISSVDYLEGRPDVDATRIGVVGHSMGGAGAILAASMEPRIRVLVSTSTFADPVTVTARALRYLRIPRWPFLWLVCRCWEYWLGATGDEVAPQNRIADVKVPVLLVHGDTDRLVPPSDLATLYGRANAQYAEQWLAQGRRHSDLLSDPEFGSRVTAFLGRTLAIPFEPRADYLSVRGFST